jgi:hypothetical protein
VIRTSTWPEHTPSVGRPAAGDGDAEAAGIEACYGADGDAEGLATCCGSWLVDRQVLDSTGDPLGISVAVYADGPAVTRSGWLSTPDGVWW